MQIKQDGLVEGAGIVGYERLIGMTQRFDGLPGNGDGNDIITALRQRFQWKEDMHKW
jgi:hypothetical protein